MLKKLLLFIGVGIVGLILVGACTAFMFSDGDAEKTEIKGTVDKGEDIAKEDDNTINNDKEEIVVDDDKVKIIYKGITVKDDTIFGKEAKVKFEIENKLDKAIEVQVRKMSVDGVMVDEATLAFSQTVASGKKANGNISVHDFEDYDFPEFKGDMELVLHVFNEEDYETIQDYDVKVTID